MAVDPDQRPRYFGGRVHALASTAGLTLAEVEYTEARTCRPHTHENAFFAMPMRGDYAELFSTFRLDYRPFEIGVHPEGLQHADAVRTPGTRFFLVELERAWMEHLHVPASATLGEPRLCPQQTCWLAMRLYRTLRDGLQEASLVAESLVLEMLGSLTPEVRAVPRRRPRWLTRVIDLLHGEYAEALTIRRIAREVDLHPVYLSRAFRCHCGEGVGGYLTRLRVRSALEHLVGTDLPIAEIALRCGFSDQSHLTRTVGKVTGITPGRLRALSRVRRRSGR